MHNNVRVLKNCLAAAVGAAAFAAAASAGAATVVGATSITIKSALPDFLQIAEVLAFDFGDVNRALAANGATASALSQYDAHKAPENGPGETIDGSYPGSYDYSYNPAVPGIYHSGSGSAAEYLKVTFAGPVTLKRLTIYGRVDSSPQRDIYNVTINGAGGAELFTGRLDASTAGFATVTFEQPSVAPEPASWAMMILGFTGAGAALRGRRRAASPA